MDTTSTLGKKFNRIVEQRVTNLALYGVEDSEILELLRPEIDEIMVTSRWVVFLANQARRAPTQTLQALTE